MTVPTGNQNKKVNQITNITHHKSPWYGTADFWTALATILLVGVGIFGVVETKETLELSERAWITTIGGVISPASIGDGSPSSTKFAVIGKPMHIVFSVVNTGKEPAANISLQTDLSQIDGFAADTADLVNIRVEPNSTCLRVHSSSGRFFVSPNLQVTYTTDTLRANPPTLVDQNLVSGRKFIVINGCFAYDTFGREHHSGFCYIVQSQPISTSAGASNLQGTIQNAAIGSPPVSVADDGRAFSVIPCASGFSTD